MKKRIITLFCITCIAFALAGCAQSTWLYRVNVQQGNIITSDMVRQLRVGMTKETVCDLIGPPVLMDTFNDNRWTYVYTSKPSRGKFVERNLVIYFKNNRVGSMTTNNIE